MRADIIGPKQFDLTDLHGRIQRPDHQKFCYCLVGLSLQGSTSNSVQILLFSFSGEFPFNVLTLLSDSKGIRPVKSSELVCWVVTT